MSKTYPAGTAVGTIASYDRSTKVAISCPKHPEAGTFHSKDPFVSSWFGEGNPCDCPTREYVTAADYTS